MRMRRISSALAVGAFLASLAVPAPSGAIGAGACGGVAPETTSCNTNPAGPWISYEGLYGTHGFAVRNYTGTLRSRLVHAGGTRDFVCHYVSGSIQGECQGSGSWPSPGREYTHRCNSFNLNSTTAGGSGLWTCRQATV